MSHRVAQHYRAGQARRRFGAHGALCVLSAVLVALVGLAALGCGDPYAELKSQALGLEERGDLEAAVEVYGQILAADPEEGEAVEAAAADLMMLGRYDEALVLQERQVALDSGDVQTRVELGFNYLNHQDRPGDAVGVLEEAVDLEPTGQNRTFLGQALIASGDSLAAEQSLRRAIEEEPGYAFSYTVLTDLLREEGRAADAAAVVEVAAAQGISVGASD